MPFTVFSREADIDYLLARMIAVLGGSFHGRAGFFCQMACEKYLKALSVQEKGTYIETHSLLDLAADCQKTHAFLAKDEVKAVFGYLTFLTRLADMAVPQSLTLFRRGRKFWEVNFFLAPTIKSLVLGYRQRGICKC